MCKMRLVYIHSFIVGLILHLNEVNAGQNRVVLSNDGPVVLGGTITFRADLYLSNGDRPSGTFWYSWKDNAFKQHVNETYSTNTTFYWTISYPADAYSTGSYRVQVEVKHQDIWFLWSTFGRDLVEIEVTNFLHGNITVGQSNKTVAGEYVSSNSVADMGISWRKGDYDFIAAKATSISTYWFIDCEYLGQSNNFTLKYNFSKPELTHTIEALVIASFDPPTTTTVAPTTAGPQTTTLDPNRTTISPITTSAAPIITTLATQTSTAFINHSFPFVCHNSTVIPPEPHKTYGYFIKEIKVRAPITNITVDGTHWLQPWELLSLNVSCKGSGPFEKCLVLHTGQYNVTGNETCSGGDKMESCSFPIRHYFLDSGVYTYVVILKNDITTQIYPLTINIYTVTPKPQLSVIIVPVSCSLAAVVLIVFGVAYYIQSRARFTVEVADFDFGQHNPEMEYKTFTERLKDSINNALRPGADRINGYEPLNKPLL